MLKNKNNLQNEFYKFQINSRIICGAVLLQTSSVTKLTIFK